jgi:hypothetical protein
VELGAQDKDFDLQVARQGWKKLHLLFPKSSILNPKSPLWGKFSCYITLHLESQQIITLAYYHQDAHTKDDKKRSQISASLTTCWMVIINDCTVQPYKGTG